MEPQPTFDSAMTQLTAQQKFCHLEGKKFKKRNSLDSALFYSNKEQELKWQIVQMQKHFEETGKLLETTNETLSVPVIADNNDLGDNELELAIKDIFFNSTSNSRKSYHLRYVVCLPLQRQVLQEQKSCSFKTCTRDSAQNTIYFNYPRSDARMCESLERGYVTVELYGERRLRGESLIGAKRIPLKGFKEQSSLKGILSFGGDDAEWEVTYAINIRRAQSLEEKDNFKMVQKDWMTVNCEQVSTSRRNSLLAGRSPHPPEPHKRRRRSHHTHHHKGHRHHEKLKHRDSSESSEAVVSPILEDTLKEHKPTSDNKCQESAAGRTKIVEDNEIDSDKSSMLNVIHKHYLTAYEF